VELMPTDSTAMDLASFLAHHGVLARRFEHPK
jgi:hypothetical protein